MAVNYVDRYLSRQSTPTRKSELQLIGVSALFFAAKLEEIYPPKLAEFAYVTDSACTEMEMREMELMMLKVNTHPNSDLDLSSPGIPGRGSRRPSSHHKCIFRNSNGNCHHQQQSSG